VAGGQAGQRCADTTLSSGREDGSGEASSRRIDRARRRHRVPPPGCSHGCSRRRRWPGRPSNPTRSAGAPREECGKRPGEPRAPARPTWAAAVIGSQAPEPCAAPRRCRWRTGSSGGCSPPRAARPTGRRCSSRSRSGATGGSHPRACRSTRRATTTGGPPWMPCTSRSWWTGSGRTCGAAPATKCSTSPPLRPSGDWPRTCTRRFGERSPGGSCGSSCGHLPPGLVAGPRRARLRRAVAAVVRRDRRVCRSGQWGGAADMG
jgi:hypothetical protein